MGFATGAAKPGEVLLHGGVVVEGVKGGFEDGLCAGVGGSLNAIVHPLAVAAGGDDACVAEVGEVAGDLGLALAEDFDEVADADLATVHEVEQAQADGVGESCEEAGEIEGFLGTTHELKYTC